MHLGRFHTTIYDLALHFKKGDLETKLEQCAVALDQYASSQTQPQLDAFRSAYNQLLVASEISDLDLKQPFSQQVIDALAIQDILDPVLPNVLQNIVKERAFDHAGIAKDFRAIAALLAKKVAQIVSIEKAFDELNVEFERVEETQAEVGILLPREVVGETLIALSGEFSKLGVLFRAINELTAAPDYDPKVRTISSSWWQVFLELSPVQILVWVAAIERIMTMFKTTLEIKHLQQQLSSKGMPKEIADLIEKEIDQRVSSSMAALASDLRKNYAKIEDEGRLNEIEVQLRAGLNHLAMRINQGSQVEINVGVPSDPKDLPSPPEGENLNQEAQNQIESQRQQISGLRELQLRGRSASADTLKIESTSQAFLKHFKPMNDTTE